MDRALSLSLALLLVTWVAGAEEPATSPAAAPAADPATPAPADATATVPTEVAPAAMPAQPTPAAEPPVPPPAPQSRARSIYTWGSVGTSFAYGQAYGSLNMGAGYLMRHGLAPNFEISYNFGNTPDLWTIRPGVTWFLPVSMGHPYVGAYYTHWFVGNGYPDEDGVGARAGLSVGRNLSLAVTYDRALGCSNDCDIWTPQVSVGFSL